MLSKIVEGTASIHPINSRFRSSGVRRIRSVVFSVEIEHPFADVAVHIVKPESVRLQGIDGYRLIADFSRDDVFLRVVHVVFFDQVRIASLVVRFFYMVPVPGVENGRRSRPARVFPFGFRQKPVTVGVAVKENLLSLDRIDFLQAFGFAFQVAVFQRIEIGNVLDGERFALVRAGIFPRDAFVIFLLDFVGVAVEIVHGDGVLFFVRVALALGRGAAHYKRAAFDQNHFAFGKNGGINSQQGEEAEKFHEAFSVRFSRWGTRIISAVFRRIF